MGMLKAIVCRIQVQIVKCQMTWGVAHKSANKVQRNKRPIPVRMAPVFKDFCNLSSPQFVPYTCVFTAFADAIRFMENR